MAENKKSVLLYCDIIHTVEELDDVDAGLLFKHYLRYINDQNPEPPSKLIKIVFEPIKQNLKRDLKKWEQKSHKNSENAHIRWNKENANASDRIKSDANHADKDTVKVTDTDTDTVNVNETTNIIGTGKNYLIIDKKYINGTALKVCGKDGLIEFYESNKSVINRPEYADKFMRDRNGKHFNDFRHLWNDYNQFVDKQFK